MKVDSRVLDVESTLRGENIDMTIDQGALAHIMSVLTDLYSDPELAVLREYSTNAFDAHVEAGIKRPIEVTLPTSLSPFLRIRDYGLGLNAEDIREIYSRYGTSTKRQSNDVVGMLGLGCKSALTYTDQFTVTGIKDGNCIQVSVSRTEDGAGVMNIVTQYETDDPSGVEILIPAKRINSFAAKAQDFFRFWDKDTVLVDGEHPKRIDGLWIADDLLLTNETDSNYVVMGNVAYPFEGDFITGMSPGYYRNNDWSVVAFVGIGEVNFTPSREALQETAKTKATLADLSQRIKKERDASVMRQINEAKTSWEALEVALKGAEVGFKLSAASTWNDISFPHSFKHADDRKMIYYGKRRSYYARRNWSAERTIGLAEGAKANWIINYDGSLSELSSYRKQKLELWIVEKGLDSTAHFIICDELPDADWINPDKVYDWEEVKKQKVVRENIKRRDGRVSGSYSGWVHTVWNNSLLATSIDTKKPIFFVEGRASNASWDTPATARVLIEMFPDSTIVVLGSNRVNKFKRDFPTAREATSVIKEEGDKWLKSVTEEEVIAHKINGNSSWLSSLDDTRVDDPALASWIKAAKIDLKNFNRNYKRFMRWGIILPNPNVGDPLSNYPLLTGMHFYGSVPSGLRNDLYIYVNAAYAAKKEV
jgi:hypothetical protein